MRIAEAVAKLGRILCIRCRGEQDRACLALSLQQLEPELGVQVDDEPTIVYLSRAISTPHEHLLFARLSLSPEKAQKQLLKWGTWAADLVSSVKEHSVECAQHAVLELRRRQGEFSSSRNPIALLLAHLEAASAETPTARVCTGRASLRACIGNLLGQELLAVAYPSGIRLPAIENEPEWLLCDAIDPIASPFDVREAIAFLRTGVLRPPRSLALVSIGVSHGEEAPECPGAPRSHMHAHRPTAHRSPARWKRGRALSAWR